MNTPAASKQITLPPEWHETLNRMVAVEVAGAMVKDLPNELELRELEAMARKAGSTNALSSVRRLITARRKARQTLQHEANRLATEQAPAPASGGQR